LQARDDWVRCIEEVSGHPEETIECDELMEEIELGDGHTIPMARFSCTFHASGINVHF